MKIGKYFAVLSVFTIIFYNTYLLGQIPGSLSHIIPPSPVATSFTIYGDYPVSYNTGVPDIQVPLHVLRCGDIEIPIVLKYHIGSAKPNPYGYEMSNIGYGWILDVSGIITRTVNGKQDESEGLLYIKNANEYNQEGNEDDYYTLNDISNGQLDSEYDIFNYSFVKGNGKFVIYKNNNGIYNASTFQYVPWKLDFYFSGSGTSKLISGIKIRDDKGFIYLFSDIESYEFANTGWFLSKIISPKNKVVNFIYNTRNITLPPTYYYYYWYDVIDYFLGSYVYMNSICLPQVPNQPVINHRYYTNAYSYYTKTIKEINSEAGKIIFTLTQNNSLIQDFTVYDQFNNPIKKIIFYRSYFPGQSSYFKLDSIWINDETNNQIERYKFEYNSVSVLNSRYTDYWGWYNGVSNTLWVPTTSFDYQFSDVFWSSSYLEYRTIGDLNRCVDETKILAQTLKKIHYPTGGYTEFIFEPNRFIGNSPCNDNSMGYGLRIKSIVYNDNNNITTKTYVYQPGNIQFDRFNAMNYVNVNYTVEAFYPNDFMCNDQAVLTFKRNRSYSENINQNIIENNIRYYVVEEYFGTENNNTGKNIYYYSYNNDCIYEYNNEFTLSNDKILITKNLRGWSNGLLDRIETYKRSGNQYIKIKEKVFEYTLFIDTVLHGLKVVKLTQYPNEFRASSIAPFYYGKDVPGAIRDYNNTLPYNNIQYFPPTFAIFDYFLETGGHINKKIIDTEFYPEPVIETTEYFYDNGFKKYVSKIVLNDNTENKITKTLTYPYDFSENIYRMMVDSNRIDYLTQVATYKNFSSMVKTKINRMTFIKNPLTVTA